MRLADTRVYLDFYFTDDAVQFFQSTKSFNAYRAAGARIHSLKLYWDTVLTAQQRHQVFSPIYTFGHQSLRLLGTTFMHTVGNAILVQDSPPDLFSNLNHYAVSHAVSESSIQIELAVNGVNHSTISYSGSHDSTESASQFVVGNIKVAGARLDWDTPVDPAALYQTAAGLASHAVFDGGALLTAPQRVTAPLAYTSAFTVVCVLTIPLGGTGALLTFQSIQLTLEITADALLLKHRGVLVASGDLPSTGSPSPLLVNFNSSTQRVRVVYDDSLAIEVQILAEEFISDIEQDARVVIGAIGSTHAPAGLVVGTVYAFVDDSFSVGGGEALVTFTSSLLGLVDTVSVVGKIEATSLVADSAALTSLTLNRVQVKAGKVVGSTTLTQTPDTTTDMGNQESPPPSSSTQENGILSGMEHFSWPLLNIAAGGDTFVHSSGAGTLVLESNPLAGLVVDLAAGATLTANTATPITETATHIFSAWLQVSNVLPEPTIELKPGSPTNHGSSNADPTFTGVDLTNERFFELEEGSVVGFSTIEVPPNDLNIIGLTRDYAVVADFSFDSDVWTTYQQDTREFLSTGAMALVVSRTGEIILNHDGADIQGSVSVGKQQVLMQYQASTASAQLYLDGVLVGTEVGVQAQPFQELFVGNPFDTSQITIDFTADMSDVVGETLVASVGTSPDLISVFKDDNSIRVVAPSDSGAGVYWLHDPNTTTKRYGVNITGQPSTWVAIENDPVLAIDSVLIGLPIASTLFQMSAADASTAIIGQAPTITGTTLLIQGPRPGISAVQTPPGPSGTNTCVFDTTSLSAHFVMAFWIYLPNLSTSPLVDFLNIGGSIILRRRNMNRLFLLQSGGPVDTITYPGNTWGHFVIHNQPSGSVRLWINGAQVYNSTSIFNVLASSTVQLSAPNENNILDGLAFAQVTYMQHDTSASYSTPIAPVFNPGSAPQVTSLQVYSPAVSPPTAALMDAAAPISPGVTGVRIHSLKFYWDTLLSDEQRALLSVPMLRFGNQSLSLLGTRFMSTVGNVQLLQDAPAELFGPSLSHFVLAHAVTDTSIQATVSINGTVVSTASYTGAHASADSATQFIVGGPVLVTGARLAWDPPSTDPQLVYNEAVGLVTHAIFDGSDALLADSQRVTAPLIYSSSFIVAVVLTIPLGATGALVTFQSIQVSLVMDTTNLVMLHRGVPVASGPAPVKGNPSPIVFNYQGPGQRVRVTYDDAVAIDVLIDQPFSEEVETDARVVIGAVGSTPAPAGLKVGTVYTFADSAFTTGPDEDMATFAEALLGLVDKVTIAGQLDVSAIQLAGQDLEQRLVELVDFSQVTTNVAPSAPGLSIGTSQQPFAEAHATDLFSGTLTANSVTAPTINMSSGVISGSESRAELQGELQYAFDNSLTDTGKLGSDLSLITGTITYGTSPVNHIVMNTTNTYIINGARSGVSGVNSIAVSAWLFIPPSPNTNLMVMGDRGVSFGSVVLVLVGGGLSVNTSGSGGNYINFPYPESTWFHMLMVADGTSVRMWVGGAEQVGTLTGTGPVPFAFTNSFALLLGDDPLLSNATTVGLGIGPIVIYIPTNINVESQIPELIANNTLFTLDGIIMSTDTIVQGTVTATEINTGPLTATQLLISGGLPDFADDSAAASGGVPLNGIYRNGGVVRIRLT